MNTEVRAISYTGPNNREGITPVYCYTELADKDIYLIVRTIDDVGSVILSHESVEGIFDAILELRGGKWDFRIMVYRPSMDDDNFHEMDVRKYEDLIEEQGQNLASIVKKVGPPEWQHYTREQFEDLLPSDARIPDKRQNLSSHHTFG